MKTVNIFSSETAHGEVDVARTVGSAETLMFMRDVPAGQDGSRYHYEYEEEWLLVVEGTLVLRAPDGEHTLERGDLVCFPPGPAGAHMVTNRSEAPARTLMWSTSGSPPAVVVYPDSDLVGICHADESQNLFFKRSTAVPWRELEEGPPPEP